jgi:hypothetical protein
LIVASLVAHSAEFKCDDRFLIETVAQLIILIKLLVEFKNSLLELKCAANRFILFSNQNQQQIYRGVPWCFESKVIGLDCPWCSVVFPWCPVVFRSLLDIKFFRGLKHHGTPGRFEA